MRYQSTRGKAPLASATEAIIKGLAPDGGLYVPATRLEPLNVESMPAGGYRVLASTLLKPFFSDFNPREIESAVNSAYSEERFDHPSITPLHIFSEDTFVLELWHGPTSAFKDIALQLLPFLVRSALQKSGERQKIVILTATSGDTGKSALEGFKDIPGISIVVYFPENGVSEIQKLQMTTQEGSNVHVAAVRGNFDQTQAGVKAIFGDHRLNSRLARQGYRLSSANSINWGRLVPQIVYYFAAYRELLQKEAISPGEKINFLVPTGNFGNILAGYYARRLGLPVNRLVCASNSNNVLTDFIRSGSYSSLRPLKQTLSPSMDILVSSNLERLLFAMNGDDSKRIRSWMKALQANGEYSIDGHTLGNLQDLFRAECADDDETLRCIAETYKNGKYLIDTHTAVGKAALEKYRSETGDNCRSVILSTASPFKFADSVTEAIFGKTRAGKKSSLDALKYLSKKTGAPVPVNLSGLGDKPVRHGETIEPEEMREHLLRCLEL